MSEKRYYKFLDDKQEWVIRDRTNRRNEYRVGRNKRYAEKIVDLLNEQQETIDELEKNFDDLVKWASEIANRNVILGEQIGKLQTENKKLKESIK